jgi:hypothetical protein
MVLVGVALACSGKSTDTHHGKKDAATGGFSTGGSNEGGAGDGTGGARASGGEAGSRAGSGGKAGSASGGTSGKGGSSASGGIAGDGGEAGADDCGCRGLIGVRPDARVECVNGGCSISPDDCEPGRADCDGDARDGCEVRTDFDLDNCGGCGIECSGGRRCNDGHCGFEPCGPGYDHCDDDLSCLPLDTPMNCGACGRESCTFQNALTTCSSAAECIPPLCAPGFANCIDDNDCETAITPSGPGCFPTLVSSTTFDAQGQYVHASLGDDGTTVLAGNFIGQGDFDPSGGEDVHESWSTDGSAFVTKLAPGGGYAWTATLDGGFGWMSGVKLASDGSIVVTGAYVGAVDFDPGPAADRRETPGSTEAFVMKFRPDGSVAWVHRFAPSGTEDHSSSADVALDASGAIYATGSFMGSVDFAPGATGGERTTDYAAYKSYLVKLASDGTYVFSWSEVGECSAVADGVSVSNNRVWVGGSTAQGCEYPGGVTTDGWGSYILDMTLGGGSGGFGLIRESNGTMGVSTTPSSVFLYSFAEARADLDPGPGVEERITPGGSPVVVKLDENGDFSWAQTLGRYRDYSLADITVSASGGVLVPSTGPWDPDFMPTAVHGVLFFVKADESPGFTLDLGVHAAPHAVATGGGMLLVAGHLEDDLYAGTGAGPFFLNRYAFEAN